MKFPTGSERALLLEAFLKELRSAGERINLVGSTEPEALGRHVADSLEPADSIRAGSRVVDLGSGAGFPGIPIAIARSDVHMTLLEIRERRVHFLRHVVRRLGLRCRVLRIDIGKEPPPERFDLALARAIAAPERALSLATPWVEPGGEIWIWASHETAAPRDALPSLPLSSGGWVLRSRVAAVPRGTTQDQ